MKVKQFSELYNSSYPEHNSGEQITVPDQTLTIKEIMQRHTMNIPMPQLRPHIFSDNIPFDLPEGLESMSKLEIQEQLQKAKQKVRDTHTKMQAIAIAREKAKKHLSTLKTPKDEQEITQE